MGLRLKLTWKMGFEVFFGRTPTPVGSGPGTKPTDAGRTPCWRSRPARIRLFRLVGARRFSSPNVNSRIRLCVMFSPMRGSVALLGSVRFRSLIRHL